MRPLIALLLLLALLAAGIGPFETRNVRHFGRFTVRSPRLRSWRARWKALVHPAGDAGERFLRRGVSKFYFVPTIANPAAPTVAEITAGTSMTPEVAEIAGWTYDSADVPVPDMAEDFDGNIPGKKTAESSSLTLYETKTGADARYTISAEGSSGYMVIFPKGGVIAAATEVEVWPVRIGSRSRMGYTTDDTPATYRVRYSITGKPKIDVPIAA